MPYKVLPFTPEQLRRAEELAGDLTLAPLDPKPLSPPVRERLNAPVYPTGVAIKHRMEYPSKCRTKP